MVRVGIVGCGRIGQKRAANLGDCPLVAVADVEPWRARELAGRHPGCQVMTGWEELAARADVDLVIVSTTNDALTAVTLEAVNHGKHVLVEKPAARHGGELLPVQAAARRAGVRVKVGFNHRFHPALRRGWEMLQDGAIGPLLYLRGRYGHGGRLGYEREWRADPARSGGGELLDQGVHLIDLARWFAGDFTTVHGQVERYYWNMPVEDNGFVWLRTAAGQVAWLHASCTEWKNLFCFEIFGRDGKLQIDGLGGSYGVERLSYYRMLPQLGPPETTIWEYPGEDQSWRQEFGHLVQCIHAGTEPEGTLADGQAALDIVAQVYQQSAQASRRAE